MTSKPIGPTFATELAAAGLSGLPFSWASDGVLTFSAAMTGAQITAVEAVYSAHDPTKQDYTAAALAALAESDKTILRCAEKGLAVPSAWASYRAALRTIVNGTAAGPLPTAPAYPAGT